jgi:hypothetical protein
MFLFQSDLVVDNDMSLSKETAEKIKVVRGS